MNKKAIRVLEYEKIILKLENYCVSEEAKIRAKNLQPETKKLTIEYALRETTEAFELLLKVVGLHVGRISDIKKNLKSASMGSVLYNDSLLNICDTIRTCRNLKNTILNAHKNDDISLEIIKLYADNMFSFLDIENEINRCIKNSEDLYDDASRELANIRRDMVYKSEQIRKRLDSFIIAQSNQKYLQDSIITMRGDRFVVPVKSEYRSYVKGMIHDQSSSGQTMYIEPMEIVNLNNELKNLALQEKKEIEKILKELTEMISIESDNIKSTYDDCVNLDFIIAKGRLSHEMNGIEAKISDDNFIKLKNARHPLISPKEVVPINIHIGDEFNSLLITGPNTGGKTVSLKTVGLFVLLHQSGLHIPADFGSQIPIFQNVFADIGDEQSIEQSLSTFSSHMTNIVDILNYVNSNSLVLFDELGAGTDPTEGAALAIAILNKVHKIGALCVATTHYSELKKFALVTDGFKNAAVEFNIETLSPTYKLEIGIPGKSNAFEISRKLGLSDEIIKSSMDLIEGEDIQFEDVLTEIEKDKQEAKNLKDDALRLKLDLNKKFERLSTKESKLNSQSEKLINEAKNEARAILKKARAESEDIIKEIKELRDKNDRKVNLDTFKHRFKKLELENYTSVDLSSEVDGKVPKKVKIGQRVVLATINQNGNIITLPDEKGNCVLQIGLMRVSANIKDLRVIEGDSSAIVKKNIYRPNAGISSKSSASKGRKIASSSVKTIKNEVDLRGKTVEEAMLELDKYFDDAVIMGINIATVIHGVGTGALKKGLENFIRSHPHVKESRLGSFGEGGAGVTIVKLG